ncbi:gliding motility lipoprotein GldH [Mucilaginibacter sp. dw_454]|uniref:gliding motility lipoprotein GldH n=1 Tax=Mucilaginibacter sp. dw_454 TaxID=2720079 RepID=UPI001BD607DD|nr:gliding motility lipoprotein GldH [Mucilaginibacter sp. dw_454]
MKSALKYLFPVFLMVATLLWAGCSDPKSVIDQNTELSNNNWSYTNKIKEVVKIDDVHLAYNLYLNLRVTADYRYSNIFVLVHQTNPDHKSTSTRLEFKLANPDGEWLGDGSGNLYSYQIEFAQNYKFPVKGAYTFELEQNMRDNPLKEVSDVGLRVEKAQ